MDIDQLTSLTTEQKLYVTWAVIGLKYLGEVISSITAGGGLRRILMSIWFGEQTPKVIADDYKKELSTTKPEDTKPVA